MDFNIDTKIELNIERLKYDHSNLRNIQNSYGYIVVYLGFIGLTFFDFVSYFSKMCFVNISLSQWIFIGSSIISSAIILYTLYLFILFFIPREVKHDRLPNFIYGKMYDEVSNWAKQNNKNPEEEVKLAYLELLEKAVDHNFVLYKYKRTLLYKTIKFALISLIPYFSCIILFNLLK